MPRYILAFLFLWGFAEAGIFTANSDAKKNYQFGATLSTATLQESVVVSRTARLGRIVTQDYIYNGATNIAYIVVTDLMERKGASAQLLSGGPGQQTANIQFTSKRGAGILSRVEVYA